MSVAHHPRGPRPYQLAAQVAVREHWAATDTQQHPLLVMATGTGKTRTALGLVEAEAGRVVWIAHREELVTQPVADLPARLKAESGVVLAERDERDRRLVFASVATLAVPGRIERLLAAGPIDLLVVDEAHHSVSRSHRQAIERIAARRVVGLTATPDREDGADLAELWEIVFSYSITDAIRDGWLVPPRNVVLRLPGLDLSAVSGRRDYDDAELGAALLRAHVVEHTVAALQEHGERARPTLVFTATVDQAQRTADALTAAGYRARMVCGETPKTERRRILRAFQAGDLDVLCNAAVLTEGTDLPRVSCLVLARPTKSWSLYTQMVGRGLRLHGDKVDCLVLDLAGATEEHSLEAAPVLIGASRCPTSPNGLHDFGPDAVCVHCGRRVKCLAAALAGGPGTHEYGPDHLCRHCGAPQCSESPEHAHDWQPDYSSDKPRRVCLFCGVTVPDPLGSLISERRARQVETAEAGWMTLRGLRPPVRALHLDSHGILYVVGEGPFRPYWLPRRGRIARPITGEPVEAPSVRLLVDDLVRRAARVEHKGQLIYGNFTPQARKEAGDTAIRLGLAQRAR